jgi:hypothetical protein
MPTTKPKIHWMKNNNTACRIHPVKSFYKDTSEYKPLLTDDMNKVDCRGCLRIIERRKEDLRILESFKK